MDLMNGLAKDLLYILIGIFLLANKISRNIAACLRNTKESFSLLC